jgi:hypothetical protein
VRGVAETRAVGPSGLARSTVIGRAAEHVFVQATDHLGQALLAAEHAHGLRQAAEL